MRFQSKASVNAKALFKKTKCNRKIYVNDYFVPFAQCKRINNQKCEYKIKHTKKKYENRVVKDGESGESEIKHAQKIGKYAKNSELPKIFRLPGEGQVVAELCSKPVMYASNTIHAV